jgi:ubiquinone/menaquinone biosynthesis C-methylase UbiE
MRDPKYLLRNKNMVEDRWEDIHSQRAWGKYPNEECVRFIGRNFFKNPREERKNIKILEVGCGQGANIWFLAKEGFDVYGIDISPSAIRKAEKYLSEAYNVKADLKVADARELPYGNNFFDIAINCASIQHLPFKDHENVYNEINRVLKQEGYFWSFHIAKGSWGYGTGNLIDYETFDNLSEGPLADVGITCMLSDKDLKSQLLEGGFEINSIEKYGLTYENQQREIIYWIIDAKKPWKR